MAADDGVTPAADPGEWLSADRIAALAGGQIKANTVRSWWRNGVLEFRVFPELGSKSNKRSQRDIVEQFLSKKFGSLGPDGADARPTHKSHAEPRRDLRVADLQDTLASLKTAADAALQALIVEAEQNAAVAAAHAEVSLAQARLEQARADADVRRVEMLRHLQTAIRGYDLALSTYLQPDTLQDLLP